MSDLISRSALMDAALEKMTLGKRVDGVPVIRETITARELDKLLSDAPAVDDVPVVHARWKIAPHMMRSLLFFCSKCGTHSHFKTRYCPDCGARMDGEEHAAD